ncbi:MAG: hypothetical protein QJR05_14870 [Thermoanaerobacterium sp.]|nr:hypothetical protein [Thermoanaerobacterium sp.]
MHKSISQISEESESQSAAAEELAVTMPMQDISNTASYSAYYARTILKGETSGEIKNK